MNSDLKKYNDKKIVFMGTPEFSVSVLKELIKNFNVILVVTQPDKEVGREKKLTFSPVKKIALESNIEVFQPNKIKNNYDKILEVKPDIIITCAYGQIIPSVLLDAPKYGAINVHASILPKLRGGAPIHHAIIEGDRETGITIMYMNEKMDEGDIITSESLIIEDNDNVGTLHNKLSEMGSKLLIKTLPDIFDRANKRIKQNNDEASYAYTIKREDELIDFNDTVKNVYNKIRGLYPFPIGYAKLEEEIFKLCASRIGNEVKGNVGEITNLYKDGFGVKCLDKELIITLIKPEGKKEMSAYDFINGRKNLLGRKFN